MKIGRVVAVVAAVAAIVGCSRTTPAVPEAVVPTSSVTSTPRYSPLSQASATPQRMTSATSQRVTNVGGAQGALTCRRGEKAAMAFSDVDAALGARITVLTIRNCGSSVMILPVMPQLRQITEAGARVPVAWQPYDPKARSKRLAPGKVTSWELSWHSNGDCEHRGAWRLEAKVGTTTAMLVGCLDLGSSYALTGESSTGPGGSDAVPVPEAAVRWTD